MKNSIIYKFFSAHVIMVCIFVLSSMGGEKLMAQGDSSAPVPTAKKNPPVKDIFRSNLVLENQTIMVPIKGSFEFVIQHKFGNVNNGFEDFYGLFAPSNIRLGFNYVPIDKLQLGTGLTKDRMQLDLNAKYAIIKQTRSGNIPVSVTAFGEMAIDLRSSENFVKNTDRISYFTQILIGRKFCDRFSAQVAPSLTYFNNVEGYVDADGKIQPKMNNMHFAIAFLGRIRLTEKMFFLMNYDQPLTQHPTNNPHPNISFGFEMATSSHDFQIFMGNYNYILPASNNFYNQNDYTKGQFQIGFNISRLWNF
jgi:Membrane bound beta barrel domain (DUF5777)